MAAALFKTKISTWQKWESGVNPIPEIVFIAIDAIELAGYKLNPLHYVYKLIDIRTGEYYIGRRTCWVNPSADKYTGHGLWRNRVGDLGGVLKKEIMQICASIRIAMDLEKLLIRRANGDLKCVNRGTADKMRDKFNSEREYRLKMMAQGRRNRIRRLKCERKRAHQRIHT